MSDSTSVTSNPVIPNNSGLSNNNTEYQRNNRVTSVEAVDQVVAPKLDNIEFMNKDKKDVKSFEDTITGNIQPVVKPNLDNTSLSTNTNKDVLPQENISTDIDSRSNSHLQSSENSEKKQIENRDQLGEEQEDDNASVLVIILQCESKSCDANIINLKWVFSDPYFTVQVCAVDPPPNVPTTKTLTNAQYMENYCMRKALTYAAEGPYLSNSQGTLEPQFWWSNIPVIIVKDSSVSNITPSGITDEEHPDNPEDEIIGGMKRRITVALDKARQADLFFLCKWHDACNKYVDVEGVGSINHGSTLKWSVQPTATQAIMYTPSSRDYIRESLVTATVPLSDLLNTNISKGNLLATVFVPNIIDFDIDLATSNDDYNKLNECAPVQTTSQTSSGVASFLWFAVIVILVILVAWALIQLGPQYISAPSSSS